MARIGLTLDRKFRRLARALDDVQVGFGEVLARGALELLWDAAYEAADDYIGDLVDVEAAAHWRGREGVLLAALRDAGGDGHAGFIDEGGSEWWPEGKPGTFRVHDLWDHAPEFVKGRAQREVEREQKGETISSLRSAAGRKGRAKQLGRASDGQTPDNRQANDGQAGVICPLEPYPTRANDGQASGKSRANLDTLPPLPAPGSPFPGGPVPPAPSREQRACGSGRAGLGILGSELVRYVEGGLGHGLVPLDSEDKAASLETAIARHGGVEAAQGFIAATVRRRDTDPQSVAWLLTVLEKAPEAPRA